MPMPSDPPDPSDPVDRLTLAAVIVFGAAGLGAWLALEVVVLSWLADWLLPALP